MVDMIKELYSNVFYNELQHSAEFTALCQKDAELWEKLQPLIGTEMIDELNTSAAALSQVENLEWFRAGFRLGASLMLELR